MRKIIIGGAAAALGVATALTSGASAGGNGADRSGLSPTAGNSTTNDQCVEGSGASTNGFVILNAPGPPGAAKKLIGEVSLKNGAPNATYLVNVAPQGGNDTCMMEATLTTNGQGNGNAHVADGNLFNGSYYVVLQDATGQEQYATGELDVN